MKQKRYCDWDNLIFIFISGKFYINVAFKTHILMFFFIYLFKVGCLIIKILFGNGFKIYVFIKRHT